MTEYKRTKACINILPQFCPSSPPLSLTSTDTHTHTHTDTDTHTQTHTQRHRHRHTHTDTHTHRHTHTLPSVEKLSWKRKERQVTRSRPRLLTLSRYCSRKYHTWDEVSINRNWNPSCVMVGMVSPSCLSRPHTHTHIHTDTHTFSTIKIVFLTLMGVR